MPMRIVKQRKPSTSYRWCPKCGARNEDYRHFCKVCATKLVDGEMIGS